MKTNRIRFAALLLAAILSALAFTGCANKNEAVKNRGVCIAYTDSEISKEFSATLNPLYAASKKEFAVGTLIAPTIMKYDAEQGWLPVLGTIEVSETGGKTVAVVRLNKDLRFNNTGSQKVTLDNYRWVMEKILRTNYFGYYNDFYKYPIEGLVAFKFNCKGLTLDEVPDFDAQVRAELASLDVNSYRQMLLDNEIAGIYTSAQGVDSLCPDGRTFRQLIIEESRQKGVDDPDFFTGIKRSAVLTLLSDIYAAKPQSEWMLDRLYRILYIRQQTEFADSCRGVSGNCTKIEGLRTGSGASAGITVTFSRVVDRDEAIRMLNLPILHMLTLDQKETAIGAGEYRPAGVIESDDGRVVRLTSDKGNLSVTRIDRQYTAATLAMGQVSAVVLSDAPTEEEKAEFAADKLSVLHTGVSYVVYDPTVIDRSALEKLSLMFS